MYEQDSLYGVRPPSQTDLLMEDRGGGGDLTRATSSTLAVDDTRIDDGSGGGGGPSLGTTTPPVSDQGGGQVATGVTPDAMDPTYSGGLGAMLQQYAMDYLNNPTRFDNELLQQGIAQINAESERGARDASSRLDEFHSQRGIVGSSVEAANMREMLLENERRRMDQIFGLGMEQARTYAQDRATAAGVAGNELGRMQELYMGQLGMQGSLFDSMLRHAAAMGEPIPSEIPAWLREQIDWETLQGDLGY